MLQLMVQRLRLTNFRFQLRNQPPAVKLANTLATLSEAYGQPSEDGIAILNIPPADLADVADISADETGKIMEKLVEKGWIKLDTTNNAILLTNTKQLSQLAGKG
jgi:CRP-like cAMP-binding protein